MTLSIRFHAAFDVAPPAGGFDRLRRELHNHQPDRHHRPAFHMRWNKMGIRLAAVVAVAVIAIALVAAYLSGQRILVGGVPAGSSGSVAAYQAMVASDYHAFVVAPFDCPTVNGPTCASDTAANRETLQKWLDDLNRFNTPPQFSVVDAQLRVHVNDTLQKIDDAAAAITARDQAKLDSALHFGQVDIDWLDQVTNGIAQTRAATSTEYTNFLTTENQILFGSSGIPEASCVSVDDPLCATQVVEDIHGLGLIYSDLARNTPPSSLAEKASTLGKDLAQADNAYLKMNNALYQKDLAALRAGNAAANDAWVAVMSDLQS